MFNSHRTIVDFVADTAFVDWIIQPTPEATTYWQRWQKEHPQLRETLEDARRAVLLLQLRGADFTKEEVDRLLYCIDSASDLRATDFSPMSTVLRRPIVVVGAVAALITLLFATILFII